jgi:hypothetical protein
MRTSIVMGLLRTTFVLTSVAFVGSASVVDAQTTTGNIRGTVTVTGGAPIGDVRVVARDLETNAQRSTSTAPSGFYYLGGLRPGRYELSVRRVGLGPQARPVQVQIGQTLDVNFQLAETAVQLAAVEVVATAVVDTRTSEVGTNISREQINNLPNFERNVLDLAKLVPGISAQAVTNTDKFIAAGGQPPEAVNIFVDGATYKNDVLRGGIVGQDASKGNPLPQGAIQEFRVLTQNYKAEFQKAASMIIVATTRSGSNQPEADFFAYGVGKAYVARDEFAVRSNAGRPNYERLQAGGNVGGPIIRDKLFYFGTYELNFRDEPAYIRLGPDTLLAPASLVEQLRGFTGQEAQRFREHLGLGKLTWNASEANTLDASFTIRKDDDFRGFGGQTAFEAAENLRINTYTGVVNFKHAGANWLNEAQVNSQFFTWNPTGRNFGVIGKNYFGLLRIGGKDTDQEFKQNRLSLRDDITRTGIQLAGDHVFKSGVSVDFLSYTGTKNFVGNPFFNFRSNENYAEPFEAFIGFGDPTIKKNNVQFGGFIQDDWSMGRKLILNLGLRWDAETNMINNDYVTPQPLADSLRAAYAAGQLVVDQPLAGGGSRNVEVIKQLGGIERYLTTGRKTRPMYKKAFQPRLGASYDLFGNGRTVLFGGGGLYFDRNYWNTLFDEQFRRQFSVIRIEFRPDCAGAANCAAWDPRFFDPAELRALALSVGRPEVFLVANDMVPPRTTQMSTGVRHAFGAQLLTFSYNGLRGRNYMNFVRGSPFGGGGLPYSTVFVTDDRVKTWYDALQLQIERPILLNTRWGGAIAYTLSKSEEQGQSQDLFWGFDSRFPTVADRPRLRAPGDQRHAIVANAIVKLPADFRFSSIVNLGSGIAVNATDATLGFGPGEQRTYVFQPPTRPFLGIGHVFAFQNMDLRLEKEFRLASRQIASVLVDVFNAFNSDNFGCFNTTINPPNPPLNNSNLNYGLPNCAGLGRRLQVGVRYGFRPVRGSL